jgi:hypothetical protein
MPGTERQVSHDLAHMWNIKKLTQGQVHGSRGTAPA